MTVVMYHYVRELEHSRFPEIKGLTVQQFNGQLEYMQKYYTFVTAEDLISSLNGGSVRWPRNAAILTFDDGYIDHFTNVFPILDQKGIQGSFFPIGKAVADHRVLDVNKIHFVLASVPEKMDIVRQIFTLMDELRPAHGLETNKYYYQTYANPSRFDTAEVAFIKTVLQRGLAERARAEITDRLFRKYVAHDETAFARELYMSSDQLMCMRRAGMYIGSHAYEHRWMDSLSPADQEIEVESSLRLLGELGCDLQNWAFNYPYGAYNESVVSILKASGARFGLTTETGIADLDKNDSLLLPRLDTNDLPKQGDSDPNEWTLKVIS